MWHVPLKWSNLHASKTHLGETSEAHSLGGPPRVAASFLRKNVFLDFPCRYVWHMFPQRKVAQEGWEVVLLASFDKPKTFPKNEVLGSTESS